MTCKFCSRDIKNPGSLKAHENACKENPDRVTRVRTKKWSGHTPGKPAWNKGLVGHESLNRGHLKGKAFGAGLGHTDESRAKLSEHAKQTALGGYVEGSGRGKKGRYKGIYCDSSWELAFVLYSEIMGVTVVRNLEKFDYTFEGVSKKYIPDFVVNGKFVEVKGYDSPQWQAKLSCFPHSIEVYGKEEMKKVLDVVIERYGKDFLKMYG